eukprot:m.229414 g.229414  ORF g.229414 m.229414 type:complete len:211 (+) comp18840_c1_seq3:170-802(+)
MGGLFSAYDCKPADKPATEFPQAKEVVKKIILLGAPSSGKTSLLSAISGFDYHMPTTCHVPPFHSRLFYHEGACLFKAQCWDMSMARYPQPPLYYRGTSMVILVTDVTKADAMEDLRLYLQRLRERQEQGFVGDALTLLVLGNKIDLEGQRMFEQADVEQVLDEMGWLSQADYKEVSARTKLGVEQAFESLLRRHAGLEESSLDQALPPK